jgi:gamma-glutamyltranspeptidase/glutathione hydrolase
VSAPLSASYRDYEVYTVPPAAGGLTLLQQLRALEGFDVASVGQGVDLLHLLIEVCKVCWRERLTRLGDPRHVAIDLAEELSETRIAALRGKVAEGLRAPLPGLVIAPDPLFGTIHLCASDAQGNVVSLTHTHGGAFGSLLLAPGTGLILSHGLSRFDPRPGWPNSIAPGKAPLNNMAPLIVLKDGQPELAIGGAGGRTILSNVFQAVVRCLDLGETVEAALAAPRFHVETAEPVHIETGAEGLAEALQGLGHRVTMRPPFGGLQAIQFDRGPGGVTAAADPRRHGSVEYVSWPHVNKKV